MAKPPRMRKRCSRCGRTRSIEQFHAKREALDGFQAWCKSCMNAYNSEPEVIARRGVTDKARQSSNGHKERRRVRTRERYETDDEYRQRVLAANRAWYHERYHNDPEYRERCKAQKRASYRQHKAKQEREPA